jgi:putative two-component system response regulator
MKRPINDSARILIVDDQSHHVETLQQMLRCAGYPLNQGLGDLNRLPQVLCDYQPDLVMIDLHMPQMDVLDVLRWIRCGRMDGADLPVLAVTSDRSSGVYQEALAAGVNDYVIKPFDRAEVLVRIRNLLEMRFLRKSLKEHHERLESKVRERTRQLEQAQNEILTVLAKVSEFRDDNTGKHTKRVGLLSRLIAEELGLPARTVELLERSAPLHDIGKVAIPDRLLLKPGRFTKEEEEEMQRHTLIGESILRDSQFDILRMAEQIAAAHHERWDGSGYPRGLRGEEIPLPARIVAVADFYDALTHARPYKRAWTREEALEEIRRQRGRHFDPAVADACIAVISRCRSIDPTDEEPAAREENVPIDMLKG